jgi:hypothetical protein
MANPKKLRDTKKLLQRQYVSYEYQNVTRDWTWKLWSEKPESNSLSYGNTFR